MLLVGHKAWHKAWHKNAHAGRVYELRFYAGTQSAAYW
jgi:hypothetical protein